MVREFVLQGLLSLLGEVGGIVSQSWWVLFSSSALPCASHCHGERVGLVAAEHVEKKRSSANNISLNECVYKVSIVTGNC